MEPEEILRPDICVIGAGSGGLSVAAGAAAFGVDVVLIEKDLMGGDCLNHGCVPSKALIAAAKHAKAIADALAFGVTAGEVKADFGRIHRHIRSVIDAIAPNDSVERFEAMGVRVIKAEARFADPRTVIAGSTRIRARRFVLATGSRPAVPPIPGLDTVDYLTNETLFDRTTKPKHLIVIGAGPIGMEMAQAHRRLGVPVTVIEGREALSREDPELAAIVLDAVRAEGVTVIENAGVKGVTRRTKTVLTVDYEKNGEKAAIEGSDILVATGRAPDNEGLGLEAAGIAHDKGGIKVGANLKTTNPRVFAIGDAVSGGLQFTHVAGHHAALVLQQILFRLPARENRAILPRVTFTEPELAHVGLTEAQARQKHRRIAVLRSPYGENDRAQTERATHGLIKIVATPRGKILGASIVGANAGEMINFWALALSKKMTLADIRGYVAPYPTMSEIGKRAAISYYAPMARRNWLRRIVRLLSRFG